MSDLQVFAPDPDFEATVEKVFADMAERRDPERSGLDRTAWSSYADLGLTLLTTPEDEGGSGASWAEAWTLHRSAARYDVPLPLGEHDLLGRWLAARAGWRTGEELLAVGVVGPGGFADVAWGAEVDTVLLVDSRPQRPRVSRHRATDLSWSTTGRIPGSHRARTQPPARGLDVGVVVEELVLIELQLRGALLRSMQIVGALERCTELATGHASVRMQFGRPLMAFQAVQAMLAEAAAEVELARAATVGALTLIDANPDLLAAASAIAVAKSCASRAVGPVTRRAHQVLGAIGTTREHDLHRFSMPALAWRDEFGSAADWDRELGRRVAERGWSALWQGLVEGRCDV